ncbi:insulinase family protein [Escherichia coli]
MAAVFVPTGYDEYTSSAYSSLLGQIVQPWFYNQLRTEEQLGYAVFAFPMSVGRQWGMGFLLQSNDKQPSFLWERYKAFFPTAEAKLRAMKPEEFAQIQQAVITQMLQAPQTLGEEASKLSKDFDRGNMRFDSRDKIVAQIKLLTPQKLLISSIRRWSSRKVWLFCRRFPAARMGKPNMCILKAGKCGRTSARCSKQCP